VAHKAEAMRIGVLSDTHVPHRLPQLPSSVVRAFAEANVNLILHAGDVDDPRALAPLSQVAPTVAVRGNVHLQDLSRGGAELPYHVELALCGRRLILTHGHRRGPLEFWNKFVIHGAYTLRLLTREKINWRIAHSLHRRFQWADIVVFGHTHKSFQSWLDSTFFFNPGSALPEHDEGPTVGLLTLGRESLEAEIVSLTLD
jgi:putative phosphoesterase